MLALAAAAAVYAGAFYNLIENILGGFFMDQNWINQNNFSIIFQKNTALSNSPDCNRMTCSLLLAQGMNKRISPIKPILILSLALACGIC